MGFDKEAVRARLKARADLDGIWLGTSDDDLDDALERIEALEAALQRITELPMGWWQEPRAVNCGPCADAHGIASEALAATPQLAQALSHDPVLERVWDNQTDAAYDEPAPEEPHCAVCGKKPDEHPWGQLLDGDGQEETI